MTRTLRYLLLFVFIGLSGSAFAQEIAGRILDDKKEPLPSAVVQVYQGGILKGGAATDFDGYYDIKPLDAGYYDLYVLYAGFDSIVTTGVLVAPGDRTTQNYAMARHSNTELHAVKITAYKKPLVDVDKPSTHILDRSEIAVIPTNQVTDLVSVSPGLYQSQRGKDVNIGGARTSGTLYIVDGVQVQGTLGIDMAQGSVDQLEVITSGIPANYGDVSGGVVNITSRGVAQKITGDIHVQHSIDGYNNNNASFSIAGPIYKKRIKGDSVHKKPVLGFALSGDFYDDNDRYPAYDQPYVVKSSVMQSMLQNPLKIVSDNSGQPVYNYASDYITQNDLVRTKIPPNDVTKEARFGGKLDYQLTDNMHITAGGTFDYVQQDQFNRYYTVFASSETPTENTLTGRGYLRFTQKFGKNNDTSRHSIISNAYYTVQADFQKLTQGEQDAKFKHNLFDYAYVGSFQDHRVNQFTPFTRDDTSQIVGTVLKGSQSTGITYTPSALNPNLANYTKEYYNYVGGALPTQLNDIQAHNAIVNGDEPNQTYGLLSSPGTTQSYYRYYVSNQYALTVDASFDLLLGSVKHSIGFGLYYQQRIERSYQANANYNGVGTSSVWQLMRGLVSSISNGNLVLDKGNPLFRINGQTLSLAQIKAQGISPSPTDTILYNYVNHSSSAFDQNLRKALGSAYTANGGNKDINIDDASIVNPNILSLNMFSADELLNSGNPFVNYYGYTYTGAAQPGNVNFNDFWTQKDANGNFTRPIGAFSPNYIAGYLLDKFTYKDIHFNVGVRVDRYSANTKVLTDPYSEYAESSIGQDLHGATNSFNNSKNPSNLPNGTVVYVDDNTSSAPSIVGYRNGNNWYDPTGKYIEDPSVLKQYTGGRDPQPLIAYDNKNTYYKITDSNYNPNKAFTDYTPQVSVQPRVSFSFPISDVADFYAHYDIYSQRPYPSSLGYATAYDYTYLSSNNNQILNNANLKPQQTYDYELGFQQKLSEHSALTITAFYKERKNMIAVQPYLYAFPSTYYTYGNRDFSTTKGSTLSYDLRATNHLKMTISYTLQFAEGTGSTPYSTNSGSGGQISPNGLLQSFIEAGLPNLRYVSALDYDSRHVIAADIDYRYSAGEGPMVAGRHIFQNAGVHFVPKARSGEPYTRYSDAAGNTVIGGINGSRLPWHYGVDMRIDKDFALTSDKRRTDAPEGVKPRRPLFLKAIITVNNLLNTRDILGVYGYTGRPDDNGYLSSSYGQQFVPQQINPVSYSTLYQIANNDPGHLNYARTISFALEFSF